MRAIAGVVAALSAVQANAHPGHGVTLPHLHPTDLYLLAGLVIAVIGALAMAKMK